MNCKIINKNLAKKLLPLRNPISHKGSYGKILNIAGCAYYQGAAYLSSIAALRIGAGLVTLASIDRVIDNIASTTPCLTFFPLDNEYNKFINKNSFEKIKEIIDNYNIISIGSGISTNQSTEFFTIQLLEYLTNIEKPVVIDADALNTIAKNNIIKLPPNSIITPHPQELSRLIKYPTEEIQKDRKNYALLTTEKYNCTTILKGHNTIICSKEKEIYKNITGNSALAKAGSGDVLVGIITGLLAQGLNTQQASILAVHVHGLAGELASKDLTEYGVLATDQINYIPKAIKKL